MKHPVNALCWCGSGRKFKKCHREREREAPTPPWQLDKDVARIMKPAKCVVPSSLQSHCSKKIVNAHTISKSANLKKLAVDGHVYGFKMSLQNAIKHNGRFMPELIGLNSASTFTGFCAHHDKRIFSDIEDEPITFTSAQCFKLAYRTLGREHYLKVGQRKTEAVMRAADRGTPRRIQHAIQKHNDGFFEAVSIGVGQAERHKELHDKILLSGDYNDVKTLILTFERTPTVMSAGGLFPEFDFQGNHLQTITSNSDVAGMICFNVIAMESGGAVVFTWLDRPENAICEKFALSLLRVPNNKITDALIRFCFDYCENTFMNPTWWDNLPAPQKNSLINRFTLSGSPYRNRTSKTLKDDGFAYDNWTFRTAIL